MSSRPLAPALVLLLALTAAGCGAADRAPDATAVARDFQKALGSEDGAAACARLGSEVRQKLESDEQKPCDQAILGLDLPTDAAVEEARVYVDSASVGLRGQSTTLFLDEAPDGWQISAAGCTPSEPGKPLDCDLEG